MQQVMREAAQIVVLGGYLYRELAASAFSLVRPRN